MTEKNPWAGNLGLSVGRVFNAPQPGNNILQFPQRDKNRPLNYRFENKKGDDKVADMYFYDIIGGWGISAEMVARDLKAMGDVKTINVRINSEGGDVFDGRAIFTQLAQHPARVITHVDGLAASIASLIMLAGNEVRIADGAFVMIHNAWGLAIGDAKEMRRMADLLESVNNSVVDTYIAKTKQSRDQITSWMDEETWMPANEAKDRGFVDVVGEPLKIAAQLHNPQLFKQPPSQLMPNRVAAAQAIQRARAVMGSGVRPS